jgi:hypothetical protein
VVIFKKIRQVVKICEVKKVDDNKLQQTMNKNKNNEIITVPEAKEKSKKSEAHLIGFK